MTSSSDSNPEDEYADDEYADHDVEDREQPSTSADIPDDEPRGRRARTAPGSSGSRGRPVTAGARRAGAAVNGARQAWPALVHDTVEHPIAGTGVSTAGRLA